jgi:mxaK protein
MRRLPVHAVFAALALAAAATAAVQALRLRQAHALNADIAAAAQPPAPGASAAAVPRDAPRAVQLARATALSQAGAYDAAFKAFSGLIAPGTPDDVARHALYNLGNMVLRQGLGADAPGVSPGAAARSPADTAPLLELAKQRYRDLLRADPQDWDARYNLERALRAAPEEQDTAPEADNTPVERRNVMLRGMAAGDLP